MIDDYRIGGRVLVVENSTADEHSLIEAGRSTCGIARGTVQFTSHDPMNDVDAKSLEVADADPARLIAPLTARELQILALVCDGFSNQEISAQLNIQIQTVKYHLMNIFVKLDVRRRTQAVSVAVHLRLVVPKWLNSYAQVGGAQLRRHLLLRIRPAVTYNWGNHE